MARKVNSISPFNITALALGLAFLYLPIVIYQQMQMRNLERGR